MKKDKQLLVRVSKEEFDYITQLSNIEGKSISCIIRELINYRYGYLKKNNKIFSNTKTIKKEEKSSENEISEKLKNDLARALNLS